MTIKEIAEQAYKTAEANGKYGEDPERAIVEKLLEEIDELETAIYSQNYGHYINKIEDDNEFIVAFETYRKDTVPQELIDIVITALAGCKKLGCIPEIDIENGLRYNRLRKYDRI